jgi:hypothetical protein
MFDASAGSNVVERSCTYLFCALSTLRDDFDGLRGMVHWRNAVCQQSWAFGIYSAASADDDAVFILAAAFCRRQEVLQVNAFYGF